jgi:nitrate/TMAO reductase-like tetraheme cytochrome c subunit
MLGKAFKTFLLILILKAPLLSQDNSQCFACHDDKTLTMERAGKVISLYVDQRKFEKSVHSSLSCVDCHSGFNPDEIPHKERIEPVDCSTCHESEVVEFKKSKLELVEMEKEHRRLLEEKLKEIEAQISITDGIRSSFEYFE